MIIRDVGDVITGEWINLGVDCSLLIRAIYQLIKFLGTYIMHSNYCDTRHHNTRYQTPLWPAWHKIANKEFDSIEDATAYVLIRCSYPVPPWHPQNVRHGGKLWDAMWVSGSAATMSRSGFGECKWNVWPCWLSQVLRLQSTGKGCYFGDCGEANWDVKAWYQDRSTTYIFG